MRWQPSEFKGDETHHKVPESWRGLFSNFNSIRSRTAALGNVLPPLELDATADWHTHFSPNRFAAVFVANLLHTVAEVTRPLVVGAAHVLMPGGGLFIYGPFTVDGKQLAPSNAAFHAALRWHHLGWGVRDVANVTNVAAEEGLVLSGHYPMASNNMLLVYRKPAFAPEHADRCSEQPAGRHRRLQSLTRAPSTAEDAWHAVWRERLECWWLMLPQPTQGMLGSCLGALGLHIGSRLETLIQRTNARRPPPRDPPTRL